MKANFSILPGVLLAVTCGIVSPVLAQSALERLERQIRQRAGAPDRDRSNPAVGQVGNLSHGSAYLGIRADDQNDRGRGVRVLDVTRGSPADKAGLRRQDLITAVAGVRVRQMTDMADILDTFLAGQGVDFDVLREEGSKRLRVTLGERQAAAGQPSGPPEVIPLPRGEAEANPPESQTGPPLPPPQSGVLSPVETSRIERLERRIDELERRVAKLERQLAEARKKGREP